MCNVHIKKRRVLTLFFPFGQNKLNLVTPRMIIHSVTQLGVITLAGNASNGEKWGTKKSKKTYVGCVGGLQLHRQLSAVCSFFEILVVLV